MEELNFKQIGERIRAQRENLKFTKKELAEKSGISLPRLRKMEQGKSTVRLEDLVSICNVLNMNLNYVLTGYVGAKEISDLLNKTERLPSYEFNALMRVVNTFDECTTPQKLL